MPRPRSGLIMPRLREQPNHGSSTECQSRAGTDPRAAIWIDLSRPGRATATWWSELQQAVEITAVEKVLPGCGMTAVPHRRWPVRVRDLPAAGRSHADLGQAGLAVPGTAVPEADLDRDQRADLAGVALARAGRLSRPPTDHPPCPAALDRQLQPARGKRQSRMGLVMQLTGVSGAERMAVRASVQPA